MRDLREERKIKPFLSSYDPFIDYYCFDEPIQTAEMGILRQLYAKRRTKPPFSGQEGSFMVKHVESGQISFGAGIAKG